MNYSEHDKFPDPETLNTPSVVRIRVVDKYYFYQEGRYNQIPDKLGEWVRNQVEAREGIEKVMGETVEMGDDVADIPVRFRNVFIGRR